jgi:uncharacterized protein DUF6265
VSLFPTTALVDVSPADLAWLTGSWLGHNGPDGVEEHWSPLGGDTLVGAFRWVKAGKVFFYELAAIEREGATVVLRIKHFHPRLIGWEERDHACEFVLVHLRDGEAAFLERDKPDARWAVYRRERADRLVSYFACDGGPIAEPGLFEYARVTLGENP